MAEREEFELSVFLCISMSYEATVSKSCLPMPRYRIVFNIHSGSA